MTALQEVLARRVVVLDGGLATELEARGHQLASALWSAELLETSPDAIRDVHRAYFAAGAEVATTASYQVSIDGLRHRGLDAEKLIGRSVELAKQARDEHGTGWVAASIGPYGAAQADGSEYRGDYGITVRELREWHRPRLQLLAAAEPDVLAVETIPCLAEVEAVLAELDDVDTPAWLSLTTSGGRTRTGEPATEAFAMARDCGAVIAVGVNCVDPDEVSGAVAAATEHSGKPAVAYPNSGEGWDATAKRWTGRTRFNAANAQTWIDAGARLIGGCCRVGPDDVAALAQLTHPLP